MGHYLIVLFVSLTSASASAQNRPKYNDAHIVEIMTVTDHGEIELAKLAKNKSSNAEIDTYADHMVTDHSENLRELARLAGVKGVGSAVTAKSQDIKQRAASKHDNLEEMSGKLFDKTYIDSMVADHTDVLNSLNQELIPAAKNEELERLLMKTKTIVESHLAHAKKIQDSLKL